MDRSHPRHVTEAALNRLTNDPPNARIGAFSLAAVDPELKGRGQASFIVPPGTKGLSQGQKYKKHGIRASHTAEVVLDDVRVPGSCLLGGKERLEERLARAREGGSSRGQKGVQILTQPPDCRSGRTGHADR